MGENWVKPNKSPPQKIHCPKFDKVTTFIVNSPSFVTFITVPELLMNYAIHKMKEQKR
jgi:hypothetical protein